MAQDYNATLNLPVTEFPMRAGLPKKEPETLKRWEDNRLYYKMTERGKGKPQYVLHDGPPYANANIHLGTALNKVLKDFVVKYKSMTGHSSPFIPGWDAHGLPIELRAIKKVGAQNIASPIELRRHCLEYAKEFIEVQKGEFKRLGTLADYDNPYLTINKEYEACQIEIFGDMAKKGYIYKGLKPVYWCSDCQTALAEAEVEYEEDPCDSIYVKFKVVSDKNNALAKLGVPLEHTYFVIWTTTTWTLPGNLAIALGPRYEYCAVTVGDEHYIMARELVGPTMKAAGIEDYTVSDTIVRGTDLEYIETQHPFLPRTSVVIVGDHVTLESGTGAVHTAPGHGLEDYVVGLKYKLPIVVPVDAQGRMTNEAGPFEGLTTEEANKAILEELKKSGALFAVEHITHTYPHCWRCKKPIIYRATEQWFCSIDDFKDKAVEAIEKVEWIPAWGEGRIAGMVRDRSDWCISRQRIWGVPIPVFYCEDCGEYLINDETISAVVGLFRAEGSDGWYTHEASDIIPGVKCPHCKAEHWRKETDIMDVWFDSGVSHVSVLAENPDMPWPCDLYLEGTDQYRGWFQSSLLTAVAWRGEAPYKAVCTHGWVVDGEGKKMSKSLGNGIEPQEITEEYGADILRLWVGSNDYHADIRLSKDILKQLSEAYRKIRNTARFILGNLNDFNPDTDVVAADKFSDLDRFAMSRLAALTKRVCEAYDKFDFHIVYHAIHNFCVVDMSNFYLDVVKDRLYADKTDGDRRRAAQTVIYHVLRQLTLLVAPMLSFTAEEIWDYIPEAGDYNGESVFFNDIRTMDGEDDEAFVARMDKIAVLREDVKKVLEAQRAQKIIGSSLESKVVLHCDDESFAFVESVKDMLPEMFIVSQVEVRKGTGGVVGEFPGVGVEALRADGDKCERCWIYSEDVGKDTEHPTLCHRCATLMHESEA